MFEGAARVVVGFVYAQDIKAVKCVPRGHVGSIGDDIVDLPTSHRDRVFGSFLNVILSGCNFYNIRLMSMRSYLDRVMIGKVGLKDGDVGSPTQFLFDPVVR